MFTHYTQLTKNFGDFPKAITARDFLALLASGIIIAL
jgi:hypothetical protein